MKVKEEPIKCGTPASDDELKAFFEHIRFIEPALEYGQAVTKEVVAKSKLMTDFIEHHCHTSHYAFQITKCASPDCFYCIGNPI